MSIQYVNAPEFKSARELRAHYDAVRLRLRSRVELDHALEKERCRNIALQAENAELRKEIRHIRTVIEQSGVEISRGPSPTTFQQIIDCICVRFRITRAQLFSIRKNEPVVTARQLAMALACKLTRMSLPDIGRRMGGRDHTTVMHARDKYSLVLDGIELSEDAAPSDWVVEAAARIGK